MKIILKRVCFSLFFLLLIGALTAQSNHAKSKLKVLYVGYDPSKPMPQDKAGFGNPGGMSKEGFAREYSLRMPSFKKLLSEYFAEVKTIDCRDWKPADSEPFDVTVFDFKTTMIDTARMVTDANGRPVRYYTAKYINEDFTKPVVFIASTASEFGDRIGLKTDWQCLCLDGDAHHINLQHPIFKGPLNKVTPTIVMKKTPSGIYHYSSGDTVPKELPMWAVVTKSYGNGDDTRIGLVSRGYRFTEGPDAEIISSGVCQKDVQAVALGRHGNFFMWGFGGYPDEMTEEAKKVFVNVVAYMKQFDGKSPITRKYNQSMATTDDVREIAASLTKEKYDQVVVEIKEFNDEMVEKLKTLKAKQAEGKQLNSSEQEMLGYLGSMKQPTPTWEQYGQQRMGKFASQFGTDIAGFRKYLDENIGYVYCDPEGYNTFTIDSSVQKIGVSNHSLKLLDTCIDMLEKNNDTDLAQSVLKKYTAQNFATAKEWKKWLSKNRSKLFFSETNGYRFMINTYN